MVPSQHELKSRHQVVNLDRYQVVNLNRFRVVNLNRRQVVSLIRCVVVNLTEFSRFTLIHRMLRLVLPNRDQVLGKTKIMYQIKL